MRPRSIPPITSTGINRKKTSARLEGLAHMSLGRYMSEMSKNNKADEDGETFDLSKYTRSDFNKKSGKKTATTSRFDTRHEKIECIIDMLDDFNEEGDFAISLQFSGIEIAPGKFNRIDNSNTCSYFTAVDYNGKAAFLILTTIGDIFEYEVVSNIKNMDRFFGEEAYIPKLLYAYDSFSMNVELKNSCVIITYKKKNDSSE